MPRYGLKNDGMGDGVQILKWTLTTVHSYWFKQTLQGEKVAFNAGEGKKKKQVLWRCKIHKDVTHELFTRWLFTAFISPNIVDAQICEFRLDMLQNDMKRIRAFLDEKNTYWETPIAGALRWFTAAPLS